MYEDILKSIRVANLSVGFCYADEFQVERPDEQVHFVPVLWGDVLHNLTHYGIVGIEPIGRR